MGIEAFINRKSPQTVVYWGNPQNDGFGGKTFDAPIEIKCRWEDKYQLLRDDTGNALASRTIVYPNQDLDEEGWLWLGELVTLTTAQKLDPQEVDGASIIKKFEKSPVLGSSTEFYRKAWLTPLLT